MLIIWVLSITEFSILSRRYILENRYFIGKSITKYLKILSLITQKKSGVLEVVLDKRYDISKKNTTVPVRPLGFYQQGKILVQEIWRSGTDWDPYLPEDLNWTFINLQKIFHESPNSEFQGITVLYTKNQKKWNPYVLGQQQESNIRVLSETYIEISFTTTRTRVAPLKPLSIPKLEFQAAVTARRLTQSIRQELEISIDEMFFWTDSCCVLGWITDDGRKYNQFVVHRIGEIQERTTLEDWTWVPSGRIMQRRLQERKSRK